MAKYLNSAGVTYLWSQIKGNFVAKETGKVLTSNDFTNELKTKLEGIEEGAQKNVITGIKLGTAALSPVEGVVTIDAYTKGEADTAIATAVANSKHASFEKADSIPTAETAKENVLYLVMNATTKHYDIYAKVDDKVELLDDTTVDLTNYFTKDQVTTAITEATKDKADKATTLKGYGITDAMTRTEITTELGKKVDAVEGKTLTSNDFTDELKTKLEGVATGAEKNTIVTVKVNGSSLTPDGDRAVDVTVPTKVSELTDATEYAKKTDLPEVEALADEDILAAINAANA